MKKRNFEQLVKLFYRSPEKLAKYYNSVSVKLCAIVSYYDLTPEQAYDYDDDYEKEENFYLADENSEWNYSMETCMRIENDKFHGFIQWSNCCGYGVILSDCGTMALVFSV